MSEFHKKLENVPQRHLAPEKKQLFCSGIQLRSVVVEFPVPGSTQKLTKRLKGAKRGIKKPTQPTIAHDETHLSVAPCVKAQGFPVQKRNTLPLLTQQCLVQGQLNKIFPSLIV